MTAHELTEEGDIREIEVVGDLLDAFLRVFQLIAHIGQYRLVDHVESSSATVNEALVQYQTAQEKRDLFAQQVNALQTAYRSTSLLMEHGTTTYLEVLTAQQSLLSVQLTQVANEVTEIQSLIQLYQALGGGAE